MVSKNLQKNSKVLESRSTNRLIDLKNERVNFITGGVELQEK